MKFSHLVKINVFFCFIKIIQICVVMLTNAQFDTSSQIILSSKQVTHDKQIFSQALNTAFNIPQPYTNVALTRFFDKLVIWDAVYFTNFFVNGITYEHEWVFGPLWWRFVHYFPLKKFDSINKLVHFYFNVDVDVNVADISDNFYTRLILAVITTNVCHYLSVLMLYILTNTALAKTSLTRKIANNSGNSFALKCALLYVINPAGIFITAPYSESAANLMTFTALYLREISLTNSHGENLRNPLNYKITHFRHVFSIFPYLMSAIFVGLGIGIRSNIILVAYVYLYDTLYFLYYQKVFATLSAMIAGLITFTSFLALNYFPYVEFCPERVVWCDKQVPFLYLFAQSHYWNVGFFQYWTANNIPNFLLAIPIVTVLVLSLRHFVRKYYIPNLKPMLHITYIFLFLGITSWHVQILTRIGGFIPLPYWYLADKLIESNNRKKLVGKVFKKHGSDKLSVQKVVICWFFLYSVVQTALFSGFLPPA